MKIEMYVKPGCPYCDRAKALFDKKRVSYTIMDISNHPGLMKDMLKRSQGRKTVPQIFIGDLHVGGCDDLYALESKGELDKLLES